MKPTDPVIQEMIAKHSKRATQIDIFTLHLHYITLKEEEDSQNLFICG